MRKVITWVLRALALGTAGVIGGAAEEHFFPRPPSDDTTELVACQRQSYERGEALIHAVDSANQASSFANKCLDEYKAHLAADLAQMGAKP